MKRSNPSWETVSPGIRDEYLRRARRGLATPAEIETELATKNLPPLAARPDPEKFDPDSQVWWTLAMTAAWIIWRTPDAVRQAWSNYRREVREWVGPQELFVEYEPQLEYGYRRPMEKVTGYTLESFRELDLFGVLLRSTLEVSGFGEIAIVVGEAARSDLWHKFESGELVAEAVRHGGIDRKPIRDADWIDLDHYRQLAWPAD